MKHNDEDGFTLIEFLVALFTFVLVTTGLAAMIVATSISGDAASLAKVGVAARWRLDGKEPPKPLLGPMVDAVSMRTFFLTRGINIVGTFANELLGAGPKGGCRCQARMSARPA